MQSTKKSATENFSIAVGVDVFKLNLTAEWKLKLVQCHCLFSEWNDEGGSFLKKEKEDNHNSHLRK